MFRLGDDFDRFGRWLLLLEQLLLKELLLDLLLLELLLLNLLLDLLLDLLGLGGLLNWDWLLLGYVIHDGCRLLLGHVLLLRGWRLLELLLLGQLGSVGDHVDLVWHALMHLHLVLEVLLDVHLVLLLLKRLTVYHLLLGLDLGLLLLWLNLGLLRLLIMLLRLHHLRRRLRLLGLRVVLNGKNGLQLLFESWELLLDDGSLLHLLMLLQELNDLLLLLLGHLINVLHVVLLHLVEHNLLLLLHLLDILLLLLGIHEYLRLRRQTSLDNHLCGLLLLLLHLRRILRHLVKELLLLNLLVHKLAGLILELLLELFASDGRRELLLEYDLLSGLGIWQGRRLVESLLLLLLLRDLNSTGNQLRNLQLHRLRRFVLQLTLLGSVHLLCQDGLLLQCFPFLLQLNLPGPFLLLLQHGLDLNLQYLGHRLRVVLH